MFCFSLLDIKGQKILYFAPFTASNVVSRVPSFLGNPQIVNSNTNVIYVGKQQPSQPYTHAENNDSGNLLYLRKQYPHISDQRTRIENDNNSNILPGQYHQVPSTHIKNNNNENLLYVGKHYPSQNIIHSDVHTMKEQNRHRANKTSEQSTRLENVVHQIKNASKAQDPVVEVPSQRDLFVPIKPRPPGYKEPNRVEGDKGSSNSRFFNSRGVRHRDTEKSRRIKENSLYKKLDAVLGLNVQKTKKVNLLILAKLAINKLDKESNDLLSRKRFLSVEVLMNIRRFVKTLQELKATQQSPCDSHSEPGACFSEILNKFEESSSYATEEVVKMVKGICYRCRRIYQVKKASDCEGKVIDGLGPVSDPEDEDYWQEELDYSSSIATSRRYNSSTASSLVSQSAVEERETLLTEEESEEEEDRARMKQQIAICDEAEKHLDIDEVMFALNARYSYPSL